MRGKEWVRANLAGLFRGAGEAAPGDRRGEQPGSGGQGPDSTDVDLRAWLDGLDLAAVQQIGDFEFVPLVRGESDRAARFITAERAIELRQLEILESGGGVVSQVEARNQGRNFVIILEGDTLVGAKQNRVVVHSVIVPPRQTVVVPVGCMERGRWSHARTAFSYGTAKMGSSLRAVGTSEKSAARRAGRGVVLDQGRLWSQVQDCLSSEGVRSDTSDYHRLIERREHELRNVIEQVVPVRGQVGMAFLYQKRFLGGEIAGHLETWNAIARRTITSFVLGARSGPGAGTGGSTTRRTTQEWLSALKEARVEGKPGLGAGTDLDLQGDGFIGSGLWYGGGVAHLAVFPA